MAEKIAPVEFTWTDDAVMKPSYRFLKLCDKQYVIGEKYMLEPADIQRSSASHAHYFACIDDTFGHLTPEQLQKLGTKRRLRQWALIETGWHNETIADFGSQDQAKAMAIYARKLVTNVRPDDYVEIIVRGNVVVTRTAKSQAMNVMGKEDFERSKADVLALLADTIGVTKKQLETQGKHSV